jgi:hypothetical protein
MAYQPNIPLATDQLSQSQSDIQGNFQAIKALVDVNHVDFANGVDFGKHNFVTFPVQSVAPVFAATEEGLYNKVPAAPFPLTAVNELFINKRSGAGSVQIPMTASILSTSSSPGFGSSGWTYLPSGILIKWGKFNTARNTLRTVTYNVAANIPVFTQVFAVQANQTFNAGPSLGDLNTTICVGNVTATTFQVYARAIRTPNNGSVDVFFVSIGF